MGGRGGKLAKERGSAHASSVGARAKREAAIAEAAKRLEEGTGRRTVGPAQYSQGLPIHQPLRPCIDKHNYRPNECESCLQWASFTSGRNTAAILDDYRHDHQFGTPGDGAVSAAAPTPAQRGAQFLERSKVPLTSSTRVIATSIMQLQDTADELYQTIVVRHTEPRLSSALVSAHKQIAAYLVQLGLPGDLEMLRRDPREHATPGAIAAATKVDAAITAANAAHVAGGFPTPKPEVDSPWE